MIRAWSAWATPWLRFSLASLWFRNGDCVANSEFYISIEKDEDGIFVGEVPQLKGCYTQSKTIDELMTNMKEVIELCLEDQDVDLPKFVGIKK